MKDVLVLLLAIAGISSASEDLCEISHIDVCASDDAPDGPPGTVEEFNEFCNFVLPFFDCTIEHFNTNCPQDMRLSLFTEMKTDLETICDKDSRLYSAITENIQCLKETATQFQGCGVRKEADYSQEHYFKALEKYDLRHLAVPENRRCLYSLFEISCFAINVGRKCGKEAQDLVIELILEFPFMYDQPCDLEVLEKFPELTELLELEHEEHNMLDLMLRRR